MAKTVVGLFDSFTEAQQVVQELLDDGFRREDISIVANQETRDASRAQGRAVGGADDDSAADGAGAGALGGTVLGGALGLLVGAGLLAIPGIGPVLAAGPLAAAIGTTAATVGAGALGAGIGAATGGIIGGLVGAGVPQEQAEYYAEGVRRGGTLVTVSADASAVGRATDIMERYNAVDIERRGTEWRDAGWSSSDADTEPLSSTARRPEDRHTRGAETVLPVVEEDVDIGKRRIEQGGVRVDTRVEERPVEEDVRLRQERVNIERRPANRPATDSDRSAFKEGSFELHETTEEPVVSKRARVVEEVVIGRDISERTETVRDTARRTNVDISKTDAGARGAGDASQDYNEHFRQTHGSSGYSYDDYHPVYNYGAQLATSDRYRGRGWDEIESEARQGWETSNPDTWEQFKDTIRYAYEKAIGRR